MPIVQQRFSHRGQRCRSVGIPAELGDHGVDLRLALSRHALRVERDASDGFRWHASAYHLSKNGAQERRGSAVENLSRKIGRPGGGSNLDDGVVTLRQSARDLLQLKHETRVTKSSPSELPYLPGENEIEEATLAVQGLHHLFKATDISQIPLLEHKALTSFCVHLGREFPKVIQFR
jgi:hypothetical protein